MSSLTILVHKQHAPNLLTSSIIYFSAKVANLQHKAQKTTMIPF